ncbi:cache domain-containing protein [Pontibacter sp. MBLB2868]|uniref:cache domain-containing protein n=1 Tax=Pontibacter sp. MBLB2868 TaxID=3451555 RepID=UPI003F74CDDE
MKAATFLIITVSTALGFSEPENSAGIVSGTETVVHNQLMSRPEIHVLVQDYEQDSTRQLVALVKNAAEMIRNMGEAAFEDFRRPDSYWRQGEKFVFVMDPQGNMLVHTDISLLGKNQLELKDVNGKPVIKGLIAAVTADPGKREGWYHFQWPAVAAQAPGWKSSYARLVKAPSGKSYIVGSSMYTDVMEREFVVDMVNSAVAEIGRYGKEAFKAFHDPAGPYLAKDAYLFIVDPKGIELVNGAFPYYEGRNVLNLQDTEGKFLIKEMLRTVANDSSGWVNYMWPKPGESDPARKTTYVRKAKLDDSWVMVGAGVYLPEAPADTTTIK